MYEIAQRQPEGASELQLKKRARRSQRPQPRRPDLVIEQILAWADAHHRNTGQWPRKDSGLVMEAGRESWRGIDAALRKGFRGLEGGSSLARLLQEQRGVRNRQHLPSLTEAQILAWADACYARTGRWPTKDSGPVTDAPGETWMAVAMALTNGRRGLPAGSSLPQLLAAHRGVRNKGALPPFSEAQILAWADAHHARTGSWPVADSGPIVEAPEETWCAVQKALQRGTRGLPGGSSLARFLERHRGAPNHLNRPRLTVEQILAWADAYYRRHQRWPISTSGPIPEAPGERWSMVHTCLHQGNRGLPGGLSLARLLARERGARKRGKPVRVLSVGQILEWADAHHARTGRWPTGDSGPITDAPGETWTGVDVALTQGKRGLPGGSSLPKLLAQRRGVRNRGSLPPLTEAQVLAWADAQYRRTGRWPTVDAGLIEGSGGETWNGVNHALNRGTRRLPGGSSLARLLEEQRGVPKDRPLRPLTVAQVLQWADAYHAATGRWPTMKSGAIAGDPGENWAAIDQALKSGYRDLPGPTTLLRFLAEQRGVPHPKDRPALTEAQILAWADAFYARHGRWPRVLDGPIEDAPSENWQGMENALRMGLRGLPGGSSLHKLIRAARG